MPAKKTVQMIADSMTKDMLSILQAKLERFKAGDPEAALAPEEMDFLLRVAKLNQDQGVADAETAYLEGLSEEERYAFFQQVHRGLPAPPPPSDYELPESK